MPDTEAPKPEKLTGKQQRFADLVLKGMNQTAAYVAAGYKAASDDVAAANASRLIGNEKVAAYVAAKRMKVAAKLEIDLAWLIQQGVELFTECRNDADHSNAGANLQRLAQLTGNWVDRKESNVFVHEDRLSRIREALNGTRPEQRVTH